MQLLRIARERARDHLDWNQSECSLSWLRDLAKNRLNLSVDHPSSDEGRHASWYEGLQAVPDPRYFSHLEGEMMGTAQRSIQAALPQGFRCYDVRGLSFLDVVYPAEVNAEIRGKTDFLVGIEGEVSRVLDEAGSTRIDASNVVKILPYIAFKVELKVPDEARTSKTIGQAGSESLALAELSPIIGHPANLWTSVCYFGSLTVCSYWQYHPLENHMQEAQFDNRSHAAQAMHEDCLEFEADVLPSLGQTLTLKSSRKAGGSGSGGPSKQPKQDHNSRPGGAGGSTGKSFGAASHRGWAGGGGIDGPQDGVAGGESQHVAETSDLEALEGQTTELGQECSFKENLHAFSKHMESSRSLKDKLKLLHLKPTLPSTTEFEASESPAKIGPKQER